jgi:hypothetical protein
MIQFIYLSNIRVYMMLTHLFLGESSLGNLELNCKINKICFFQKSNSNSSERFIMKRPLQAICYEVKQYEKYKFVLCATKICLDPYCW